MPTFATDELILAFAYDVLLRMEEADGTSDPAEVAMREAAFSRELLRTVGFVDDKGALTERYRGARDVAAQRLPSELDEEGKLDLLTRFFDMALVDGHLDRHESSLLYQTAHALGVSSSAFDAHLTSHDDVGELDLPEPEEG